MEAQSLDVRPPRRPISAFEVQEIASGVAPTNPVTGTIEPPLDDKARIYPGSGVIQVNREWWASLSDVDKRAVLSHERAHEEDPRNRNEGDMDERAGAMLRHDGVSRAAAIAAFARVVEGRRTSHTVARGWDLADAAIRGGKALDGKCSCPACAHSLDGFSEGLPDVDGTSFEDPAVLAELAGVAVGGVANGDRPTRRPPSQTAPPATPGPLSVKREIVIPVLVAIAAAIIVYVVTTRKG